MVVKGKTVVILVNDHDWQMPGRDGLFEGRAMTYYGRWTYKFEEAARQGAAARRRMRYRRRLPSALLLPPAEVRARVRPPTVAA